MGAENRSCFRLRSPLPAGGGTAGGCGFIGRVPRCGSPPSGISVYRSYRHIIRAHITLSCFILYTLYFKLCILRLHDLYGLHDLHDLHDLRTILHTEGNSPPGGGGPFPFVVRPIGGEVGKNAAAAPPPGYAFREFCMLYTLYTIHYTHTLYPYYILYAGLCISAWNLPF